MAQVSVYYLGVASIESTCLCLPLVIVGQLLLIIHHPLAVHLTAAHLVSIHISIEQFCLSLSVLTTLEDALELLLEHFIGVSHFLIPFLSAFPCSIAATCLPVDTNHGKSVVEVGLKLVNCTAAHPRLVGRAHACPLRPRATIIKKVSVIRGLLVSEHIENVFGDRAIVFIYQASSIKHATVCLGM